METIYTRHFEVVRVESKQHQAKGENSVQIISEPQGWRLLLHQRLPFLQLIMNFAIKKEKFPGKQTKRNRTLPCSSSPPFLLFVSASKEREAGGDNVGQPFPRIGSAGKQQEPQRPGLLHQEQGKKQCITSKEQSQSKQGTSVLNNTSSSYFLSLL